VFLDEIGDMPRRCRSSCCACCRKAKYGRSGRRNASGRCAHPVGHPSQPRRAIASGEFREDLYTACTCQPDAAAAARTTRGHSAAGASIPPVLTEKYRRRINGFAPDALDMLTAADWPGNIRQLQNVLEQCCALCTRPPSRPAWWRVRYATSRPISSRGRGAHGVRRDYLISLLSSPAAGQRRCAAGRTQPHRGYRCCNAMASTPACSRTATTAECLAAATPSLADARPIPTPPSQALISNLFF